MPSQNTWASVGPLKNSGTKGRVRTWSRTPNFGSLPKDSLPVNPYDDWVTQTQQSPTTSYYQTGNGSPVYVYNGAYPITNDDIVSGLSSMITLTDLEETSSDLTNAAIVKALGKVADAKTNIAVTLAEASKTSDLILDTARRIDRAYRALRRGHFSEVARLLHISPGTVHKTWLEYKYGWMPLLHDVRNSAEFFAQQVVGRKPRFKVTAREKWTQSKNRVTPFTAWGSLVSNDANYTEFITSSNEVTCKIWCEIENPALSQLQQLGVTNPALVAWELVPYSFVFDWFYQVGSLLEASTALHGVTVRRAVISNVVTHAYSYLCPATSRYQGETVYVNGTYERQATNRHYARASFSPDTTSIWPPKGKGINNIQKMLTSLALLKAGHRSTGTRI